ncbi:MAG TPA: DinB family protein [Chitinophagales bacterium]|nr:DinB family protein [Chitinophagales bacterium]
MKITRPNPDEYAPHYETYISKVDTDDPIKGLRKSKKQLIKLISKLNKKQLKFRYAEGKWTIKEILVHMMDGERIFGYRALRFARNDKTALPGFEENDYAPMSKATKRKIKSILREYEAVRDATISLYENLDEEMMMRMGTANNNQMSVRALVYVTLGHELHHIGVIKEKYLS